MTTTRTTDEKTSAQERLTPSRPARHGEGVAQALTRRGIRVDEQFVRQVRFELLKEATRATVARVSMPVRSPGLRRRPQGFPGRRGNG
jgi:hypothetical protein